MITDNQTSLAGPEAIMHVELCRAARLQLSFGKHYVSYIAQNASLQQKLKCCVDANVLITTNVEPALPFGYFNPAFEFFHLNWQRPLKWGILGCGQVSRNFIDSMYRKSETPNVVHAVATSNSLERAQNFKQSLMISDKENIKTYGSYEELLADPECDIIYIGILNVNLYRWTVSALVKGKHVLCEMPLQLCTEMIVKKARHEGLFLMEAFWCNIFPLYRKLRSILDKKELGAIKTINANIGIVNSNSKCSLFDTGIYCVQFALFCLNNRQPSLIRANAVKNKEGKDISGNVYLEFNGGKAKASLMWETECICPNSAFVAFEKGMIEIPDWFHCPSKMQIIKGKTIVEPMDTAAGQSSSSQIDEPEEPELLLFENDIGMHYEIDHINECIRNGLKESPVMPLESSIRLSAVIEEIRRQIGVAYPAADNSPTICNIL